MLSIYNTASICAFNDPLNCGLRLQPDLNNIMAKSRNWDELQHVWTEWRRNSGRKMKDSYEQMVFVSNDAAKKNSRFLDKRESCYKITIINVLMNNILKHLFGVSNPDVQLTMSGVLMFQLIIIMQSQFTIGFLTIAFNYLRHPFYDNHTCT